MNDTVTAMTGLVEHVFYDEGKDNYWLFLESGPVCGEVEVRGRGKPQCLERARAEVRGKFLYQQPIFGSDNVEAIKILYASGIMCH
ncbi:MAG: hypothetical protein U1F33_00415 [Alphaproteobacteria bacterium]